MFQTSYATICIVLSMQAVSFKTVIPHWFVVRFNIEGTK